MNRFQATTLAAGAAVCLGPALALGLLDVPREDLRDEIVPVALSTALLYSPYVGLAVIGERAKAPVGYGALAVLLLLTGIFLLGATSDAQGGLTAFYTLPAQWVVAVAAGAERFRRAPPG